MNPLFLDEGNFLLLINNITGRATNYTDWNHETFIQKIIHQKKEQVRRIPLKKSFVLKILLVAMLLSAIPQKAFPQADDGRHILDNLYTSDSRMPITTLVADLKIYTPIKDKKAGSSMTLSSKDKLIFKRPNKLKIDSVRVDPGGALDGKQKTIISDGKHAWMYLSIGQYPVKKGPASTLPSLNLPPRVQVFPQDADNRATITGTETVKGVNTKVVKVADSSRGIENTIWVDTNRWVPMKWQEKRPDKKGKGHIITTCVYRDFKKLKDGRWFPFIIEVKVNKNTVRLVKYEALSVNVKVDDHMFEPMKKFIR